MKPKNKFHKQVFELSKKLPPITKIQKEWAFQNCIEHIGRKTSNGVITCMECGHAWQGNSHLADALLGVECPECSAKLKVTNTRIRVFKQSEYFCIVTAKGNFQVLRFFLIQYCAKAGRRAEYVISEVVQRWITPNGKYATVAILSTCGYSDYWNFNSTLEIRRERELHSISPTCVYPRQKLIPELKRSGYKGENYNLTHFTLFQTLLSDNRAETLLKAGQTEVLRYCAGKNFQYIIDNYWSSIKICIRNGYHIKDMSDWKDYIDLLRFFGKDLHNAQYVCPADLTTEHDRYVKKKREYQEQERREHKKKKALESEKKFYEMKSRFFGIQFTDGNIQVRVLESVEEIMQEGDLMHHCVFTNEYHLKPDSLILSACIGDKRIETIEFSLSKMQVVQCRGIQNKKTEYHDQIISLVKKNKRLIQKRIAA